MQTSNIDINLGQMKKMIQKIAIFSIVFLGLMGIIHAKEVNFEINTPQFVKQGERFKITFSLNEKPENNIQLPPLEQVQVLFGPSISSSTSIEIINGDMKSQKSYTYSYILLALKEGKIKIPEVSATIKGTTYKTKATTIEVVKNNAQTTVPSQQSQRQSQSQRRQTAIPSTEKNTNNFFVRVHLNKNTAYPNEHIIATLKLYTRYAGISNVDMNTPSFKGFISKEIPNSGQNQFIQENINGTIYNTVVIAKYVLFPQQSGKIIIDDFSVNALAQQRTHSAQSIFDDFFGNNVQQIRVNAKSPKITVSVHSLPANPPTDFHGGIGNFILSSSMTSDSVAVNEAVTFKIKIKGNGNLQMLKAPKLELSPDLEVYDPKITNNNGISTSGMNGTVSYEYLIIPRHPGIYKIPPIAFSYFNPQTKNYKTDYTKAYTIKAGKANVQENNNTAPAITRYQNTQQDVTSLGNDIKYIKTTLPKMQNKDEYLYKNLIFRLFLLGIPLLFIIYLIFHKNYKKQTADTLNNKSRKANKIAIKRLQIAQKSLRNNEKEAFYTHTLDALWGFVSDKLHLPLSQLNKENITEHLQKRTISEDIISEYLRILNECEMAQYAPDSSADMNSNYQKAVTIISKLEQKL